MTVSTGDAKAGPYTGNDSASSFAFSFKVFSDDDIRVVGTEIATGIEADLVLNTDYAVTRNADQDGDPGGNVTYKVGGVTTAYPSTQMLTIVGDFDYEQPTDIPSGGSFFATTLETAFDRQALLIKQLKEKLDRAVTVAVSSSISPEDLLSTLVSSSAAAEAAAGVAAAAALEAAAAAGVVTGFDSVSSLRLAEGTAEGQGVTLFGYYVPGDGGGGLFNWAVGAVGTYTDDEGITFVPTGGDGSGAWIRNFSGPINGLWFGMIADYGAGNTDNKTAFDAAVSAVPTGGTLHIPNGQYYFASATAPIAKYMAVVGDSVTGVEEVGLMFDDCSGLAVEFGYMELRNLSIWGITIPATPNIIPGTGNVGLSIGVAYSAPRHLVLDNIQIGYFNTGILASDNNIVYSKVHNIDLFYNDTGLALREVALDSTWSQVHIRNSAVYGLFVYNSYARFDQILLENNGTPPSDFDSDANADYYGVKIIGSSSVDMNSVYLEQNSVFVETPAELRIDKMQGGGGRAIFGSGDILITDDITSESLLPANVLNGWTATNCTVSEHSTGGLSYKIASTAASGTQILVKIPLSRKIIPTDISGALLSFDMRVAVGSGVTGFDVVPSIALHQPSGRQDSVGLSRWRKASEFGYSASTVFHKQSFYFQPRYGTGVYLDVTETGIDYIQVILQIPGDFSAETALTAYLRGISLQLFTSVPVSQPTLISDTWTPADGSGAGLSFTGVTGTYTKIGRQITCAFGLIYPSTANGSEVLISGLPFAAASGASIYGGSITYTDAGSTFYIHVVAGTNTFLLRTTAGAGLLNSALSGKAVRGVITYFQP